MSDKRKEGFVIAAPENVAARLVGILSAAGMEPDGVYHAGEEALAAIGTDGALLLTTYRLPDMTGEELARRLDDACEVLMIVPQDFSADELPERVLLLRNPISQDALAQALRTMEHCRARMDAWRRKADKLERALEDRKVIDRAKGKLMDTLHLSESEAHYRIQKQSMDTGRRVADVAREILASAEGAEGAAS